MNDENPTQIPNRVETTATPARSNQTQLNHSTLQNPLATTPTIIATPQELFPLAHSGEENKKVDFEAMSSKYTSWFLKIVSLGLVIQGAYHLFESLRFILVEAPEFSTHLSSGDILRDEIILLSSKAVVQFSSASFSLFLALHLTKMSEKTTENIHLLLAVLLFFTNALIIDFFRQIEVDILLSDLSRTSLEYFLVLPQRFIEFIPFL